MQQRAGQEYSGPWQAIVSGSQFVAAVEIGDATPTLTIDSVRVALVESMDPGKGAADKLVIYFREARRGWIVNVTNATLISTMFGDNVQEWVGKRVTLKVEPVRFGGNTLPGIRVAGSPDIPHTMQATIKMPRKKPQQRTLTRTVLGHDDGNGGMGDRE